MGPWVALFPGGWESVCCRSPSFLMEAAVVSFALIVVAGVVELQASCLGALVVVFLSRGVSDVLTLITDPCVVAEGLTVDV